MSLLYKEILNDNTFLAIWEINEEIEELKSQVALSEEEELKFNSFKGEQRKRQWLAVRILLKILLNKENTEINYDNNGKPYLDNSEYHISISHSKSLVSVIVSKNKEIGIDIEFIAGKVNNVIRKFLSKEEIKVLDEENRLTNLHFYWGAKETLYKLFGVPGLIFNENIYVEPIENFIEGQTKGYVILDSKKHEYNLYFKVIDGYMLVYSF